jgi:hypothetical protein
MRAVGEPEAEEERSLEPGTRVDVRDHFERTWVRGFAVTEVTEDGSYRVHRVSDNAPIPGAFARATVRRERKRRANWWY